MDPHRFLAAADRLANSGEVEDRRTAISRAYYAAHNVAVGALTRLGLPVPQDRLAHTLVPDYLANAGRPDLRAASNNLDILCRLRERADYRMGETGIEHPNEPHVASGLARRIIAAVDTIESLPPDENRRIFLRMDHWRRTH